MSMHEESRVTRRAGSRKKLASIAAVIAVAAAADPAAAQAVRSAAGATPADLATAIDAFRTGLGGGTTAGANGSFGGVRREINWDGVPPASATPNNLSLSFFNTTSPRGVVFSTPGSGVQVSAATTDSTGVPVEFGNINAQYIGEFQPFSPQRLFSPVGSNVVDLTFFIPGTNTAADVRGFGAVFTDVDVAGATTVRFFNASGVSFAVLNVPAFAQGLSFVGSTVGSNQPNIARVRITLGNASLGPMDGAGADVVAADDFLYTEPAGLSLFNNGFED